VPDSAGFSEALLEMSKKRLGMTAVLDATGRVSGIFTDGDLRRTLARVADIKSARIAEVMTRNPSTIRPYKLAVEAVQIMEESKINQLLVVSAEGELVGALNMHDLFQAKVI
jgi:arabinose-5-phosphate isomerase